MKVKIKKLSSDAIIPTYAKASDAGLDLVATSIISGTPTQITYGLGISLEIPDGFVGLVFPRSSIRNYDLALTNSVGVIDSGYRGELQATFKKTKGLESKIYEVGERVVQIIIIPHPSIEFIEVEELTTTERGEGGFGSTGK
jgi:dUTP pyrophosphatase